MFKKTFWNGVKAIVPIALTLGIVIWLFQVLENFFGRFIQYFIPPEYYFKGMGILFGLVFIYLIGILVNAWVIKWIYDLGERIVKRIPGIKTIYNAIQDLVNFFDKSNQSEQQQAVLVELPFGRVVGFVTRSSLDGLPFASHAENELLVYIPMSYQIGGFAVVLPRDRLTPLKWPADQVMSFILTAGMTSQSKQ